MSHTYSKGPGRRRFNVVEHGIPSNVRSFFRAAVACLISASDFRSSCVAVPLSALRVTSWLSGSGFGLARACFARQGGASHPKRWRVVIAGDKVPPVRVMHCTQPRARPRVKKLSIFGIKTKGLECDTVRGNQSMTFQAPRPQYS